MCEWGRVEWFVCERESWLYLGCIVFFSDNLYDSNGYFVSVECC